ncbi:DUF4190 domain-containing protein, partial [Clavibacter lycopersici]
MSDDRDPDRTDGSHPDEPRGEGAVPEETADAGGAEAADPVSPYGPAEAEAEAAAAADPVSADAPPAPDAFP